MRTEREPTIVDIIRSQIYAANTDDDTILDSSESHIIFRQSHYLFSKYVYPYSFFFEFPIYLIL